MSKVGSGVLLVLKTARWVNGPRYIHIMHHSHSDPQKECVYRTCPEGVGHAIFWKYSMMNIEHEKLWEVHDCLWVSEGHHTRSNSSSS